MLGFSGPMESDRRSAELVQQDFQKAKDEITASAERLASNCQISGTSDEVASLSVACSTVPDFTVKYSNAAETLRAAIAAADRVFNEETEKQKAILQTAEAVASR